MPDTVEFTDAEIAELERASRMLQVELAIAKLSEGRPYQVSTDRPENLIAVIERASEIGATAYPVANPIPGMDDTNRTVVLIPMAPSEAVREQMAMWGLLDAEAFARSKAMYEALGIVWPSTH